MITLGAHFGGPELHDSPIQLVIRSTMKAAKHVRGDWIEGSTPGVNVVFYIPGSLDTYGGLEQIEPARFSRKQKLLLVAVPVPKDVAEAGGSTEFVIGALRQAVAIAAKVFSEKNVGTFDLAKAEAIIEKVRTTLAAPSE